MTCAGCAVVRMTSSPAEGQDEWQRSASPCRLPARSSDEDGVAGPDDRGRSDTPRGHHGASSESLSSSSM